ncbi:hypothetical protein HPC49_45595 [Pyxidicoccus fallax]|uniref:Uncharacterized protein n=1 Tax=Pyxidicoccus fallax TaxID=394095 RepID=A0A848LXR4_9BACT|nr:hypothetical protein [Pyxidicoccus fallax]NMO22968.1 hypothetical protein [Pyxidicoccus fallax]NPC85456.1 hypothetical protein [Pyxidicoccus fallax]
MSRNVRRWAVPVLVGAVLVGGLSASARPRPRPKCFKVWGTLTSTMSPGDCDSPVGICTTGEFRGDSLLKGRTTFVADSLGPAASTEAATTLVYSGLLTIRTKHGTLTTRDTGILDTENGLVAARDVVVGGTGIFAGATGHILFQGTGTSTFVNEASGEICLQR